MEHNKNKLTTVAELELVQAREARRAAEEDAERGCSFSGGK